MLKCFLLKPAPFCKLFALCSTNKSTISLLLLSDSRSVLSSIFPFTSISLAGTAFSLLLQSCSLQLIVVSLLISLVSNSSLFSDWRRTVSSKFFDRQVSSIFIEELVLPRHARCVLSHLRCNGRSRLLSSYLTRIGRIENLSCSACGHLSQTSLISFCIVQLRTTYAARSLATLCLSTTSGPGPEELPSFWGSMVFCHAPIPRKGSDDNNNST